jgi:TIR domain
MKIFISWSGKLSHAVAKALRDWLPSVLQSVEPYVSSEDIEKGARWGTEISRELNDTDFGILCVTRDNANSEWLNFEAGALSKSIDTSRVSPFLLGLRSADLIGPLSQFQATLPERGEVTRLLKTINSASEKPIEEPRLVEAANMWWPKLDAQIKVALSEVASPPEERQRDTREMIEELLEITRSLQRRLVRTERTDSEERRVAGIPISEFTSALSGKTSAWTVLNHPAGGLEVRLVEPPPPDLLELLGALAKRYGAVIMVTSGGELVAEFGGTSGT